MKGQEKISERKAAEVIKVTPRTLLSWRRKNLIPQELFEIKKYIEGNIRVFYFKESFLEWYRNNL
ncbi:hypothetical protein [Arcobacter cloacae]|uniref:Uncharacterized protein n=1 Tax=Arcobacter cloacae TaxID=1054034 RepID=A0A6M8NMF2_9BACT|nr:hypothetical protein [Arcobacter cloacae]QKF89692.1 hypothetical protein ACLO_1190 [Arcobacter cloacae]RXI40688.1 hypothetical protein CP963_07890 [Arcobacter cloacae]